MAESHKSKISNPFRPGAGHMPPYLAGREAEQQEFLTLVHQELVLKNLVLTGLRGVGKTVLLETFKPIAIEAGWLWAGTDLSESSSITEESMALRLLTDLSLVTGGIVIGAKESSKIGFMIEQERVNTTLNFPILRQLYEQTPGLVSDKLKAVLEMIWPYVQGHHRGIVFAYDEAQNLEDHSGNSQYPLSLLLDVFQSIQRKNIPYLLILAGLPTLFPKLVRSRTFAERMFRTLFLNSLDEKETLIAIRKPLEHYGNRVKFLINAAHEIWLTTHGYPYFIQYVCREAFDIWLQSVSREDSTPCTDIPMDDIVRKLDSDFFSGRWARATDRQRALLEVVSELPTCDSEFTVQEIVEYSHKSSTDKPFNSSNVNQMLGQLTDAGLIYKNRHGKYSFAVPLLGDFIQRQGRGD